MERSTSPLQLDSAGNGTVFSVLEKNGPPEAISGLGDGDAAPVTRADLEAATLAASDSTPDLSTEAGRESFIGYLASVMASAVPGCEEPAAHPEPEPEAGL
jgi:hypothetical protein